MKVAVIGAGIAGLTVAKKLAEQGMSVSVFEKSRGVGGRLANKRLEWGNVDIGAQYFTARDERFIQQVQQWQSLGVVAPWQFEPHRVERNELVASPDSVTRYVGTPKINSIAHAMVHGLAIAFNTRVVNVKRVAQGWQLRTEDGNAIGEYFDWVVISAPAEQSSELAIGTALEGQIPTPVHEPCWALALATKGEVPSSIQGVFGDEVVSWVSRLSSRPARSFVGESDDVWMLHFSSEWSARFPKEAEPEVAQIGLGWLNRLLAPHTQTPLTLTHACQHYWRYARVNQDFTAPGVLVDAATGIAAVGDWALGGRVEGAYLSALHFVDYLLE